MPDLTKFTYYLTNDLAVTINNIESINSQITIRGVNYSIYIYIYIIIFSVNNFTELAVPLLFLRYDDNVSKFNFNGKEISFSSETNDIIGIGDGLSLIVLSNDNNLLHVKIFDTIDMIQDLSSFSLRDIQADDKETLSRAYSQINSLYKNDSEYNNLPIIITNKIDIDTTVHNSCEFIKDKDRS